MFVQLVSWRCEKLRVVDFVLVAEQEGPCSSKVHVQDFVAAQWGHEVCPELFLWTCRRGLFRILPSLLDVIQLLAELGAYVATCVLSFCLASVHLLGKRRD